LPLQSRDLREASERGEPPRKISAVLTMTRPTGMPAKARGFGILAHGADLVAERGAGLHDHPDRDRPTAIAIPKPQCSRLPLDQAGAAVHRAGSPSDFGQPMPIGSLSGPSSSIETNSSMMKLKSRVVTTSSTPNFGS
jgi:hypothetical protein